MAARVTPNNLIGDARMTYSILPDDLRFIASEVRGLADAADRIYDHIARRAAKLNKNHREADRFLREAQEQLALDTEWDGVERRAMPAGLAL